MSSSYKENYLKRFEISNLVKPFLNLNKSVKCVQGNGGFRYFQYSSLLLEHLEIEHPVLQYIVGVSQDFQEQYGSGTADVLLFYIQSWTRVAENCTKMGISDQLVTSLIKEIVNECIKHLQSSKITLNEVQSVIPREVMDAKFSMKTQGIEGLSIERPQEDIGIQNNDNDKVSRMMNEMCTSDSRNLTSMNKILQSVTFSRLVNNHEERHIEKENEQNSLHNEYDKNNVKVVHPEIKHDDFTEETEDVSWYFDDSQTGTGCEADLGNILKVNDAADIQDSGCDEDLTETSANETGANETSANETSANESGANETSANETGANLEETDKITRDINQLRLDIEADLKQLAERKDKTLTKTKNCNESGECLLYLGAQRNTHSVDDEFDSCFDNSDSEFDSCFEEASSCKSLTDDKNVRNIDDKKIEVDADAFKTVEFRYSEEVETCLSEDNNVKDKLVMSKTVLMHMQNLHIKNLKSEDNNEVNSIDTEVRNCTSDYLKTKERLKCIESYVGFKHCQLESERCETKITKDEQFRSLPHKQHISEDHTNDMGCSSADQRNEHLDKTKSQNVDQIKHINTLLCDITKVSKTAVSQKMQIEVHSRHFWKANENNVSSDENDQNVGKVSELNRAVKISEGTTLKAPAVLLRSRHMNNSEDTGDVNNDFSQNTDTCNVEKEFAEDWNSDHLDTAKLKVKENTTKLDFNTTEMDFNTTEVDFNTTNMDFNTTKLDLEKKTICKENSSDGLLARSVKDKDFYGNSIQCETDRNDTLCNAQVIYGCNVEDIHGDHIRNLVSSLLYGRDDSLVDVVTDVVERQSSQGEIRLKMNTVSVHGRVGVMAAPSVIDGIIVKVSNENVLTSQLLEKKSLNALMVNGDLSVSFHHKGYKPIRAQETVDIDEFIKRTSRSQQWQEDLISTLNKFSVTLVLVKGNVSQDVQHLLMSHHIALIDSFPYSQLEQLSEAAQTDMLTYVTLATQEHVCRGVTVQSLEVDWCDKDRHLEVIVKLTDNCPQTIVVVELTTTLVDLREQELWDCLHQLNSALHCGFVIPGAGIAEEICRDFLTDQIEVLKRDVNTVTTTALQYRLIVTQEVMSSFIEYMNLVRTDFQYTHCALESWESKTETWKLAIDVVSVIRNMDTFIVTGLQDNQCDAGTL